MSDKREINYVKLSLAVCAGILLATSISTAAWLYLVHTTTSQQVEALNEMANSFSRQAQQSIEKSRLDVARQQAAQRRANEQRRFESKDGQKLARECREYSDFHANQPGPYAQEQRDKACEKLRTYIETGQLSR